MFTKKDTLVTKGVAIILLLIHHLFFTKDYDFSAFLIGKSDYVNLAKICKICVAMFLILSGYGLAASYRKKKPKIISFYCHSFSRLYREFLPVSVLFFIIALCLNNWNLSSIYGKYWIAFNLKSLFGLSYFFNENGVNGSWWFVSLLIVLYFLFPFLYKTVQKIPLEAVVISFLLFYIPPSTLENGKYFLNYVFQCLLLKSNIQGPLTCWLNPFIIGIAMERICYFEHVKMWEYKTKTFLFLFLFIILSCMRLVFLHKRLPGEMTGIDSFIAVSLITFVWLSVHNTIYEILAFIGKHSMNIYFVHIFIMLVYLNKFTYAPKYPPLILMLFILICLSFSIILEKMKEISLQIFKRGKKYLSPQNEKVVYLGNGGKTTDSGNEV